MTTSLRLSTFAISLAAASTLRACAANSARMAPLHLASATTHVYGSGGTPHRGIVHRTGEGFDARLISTQTLSGDRCAQECCYSDRTTSMGARRVARRLVSSWTTTARAVC